MKNFNKNLTVIVSAISLALVLAGPITASAATDPGLSTGSKSFSVMAQTSITGTANISGNVGINSTGAGITALTAGNVGGIIYSTDGIAPSVASPFLDPAIQANLSAVYTSNIPSQPATSSIGPVLDGLTVTPGVYDIGAGRLNGGVLTLNGAGIYIFRASSDLVSSGTINLINGARACDVYWNVQTLATIDGTSFVGTILAGTGVHFGANVALNGRALAVGGDVTWLTDTISGPTCAVPPTTATLTLVKTIVGGTRTFADFPLTATGPTTITGASASTAVTGATVSAGTYALSEITQPDYTAGTWSCIKNADPAVIGTSITLGAGDSAICTIQNTYIAQQQTGGGGGSAVLPVAPLIDVTKIPNPLALPNGTGTVTYTYAVHNIGTLAMNKITVVDDSCSPLTLVSGDTSNATLNVGATWTYTCSTKLSATHTNTVVATGWANNISSTDIATATVVVGTPIVPPLIHVTKIPSPFALPAGGGMVTYTKEVTNPGTIALSNVQLVDDKCGPVKYISGDTNGDSKLDPNETWTYTCSANLTKTTTNTVTATGQANGFTARDFAIATVVVAEPSLPNTGFPPEQKSSLLNIIMLVGVATLVLASLVLVIKKHTV